MGDVYSQIKRSICAMNGRHTPLLLTGKVESVDGETCTISVGELKLTKVRLRSVINGEKSQLLVTPKTGSYVTAVDISGELRQLEIIGWSEIEKIDIGTGGDIKINCNGTVVINDGDNHGMAKVEAVADKISAIEKDINNLKNKINGWTPVVYDGGAALKTAITSWATKQFQPITKYQDLENKKVKH